MGSQITIAAYIAAIIIVLVVGTIGSYIISTTQNGFNVRINSLLTALYFTVTTVSTVGYGDIYPVSPLARIFVIILILGGLGVFLGAVTNISGELVNSRLKKLSGRISGIEKRTIRNHITLIGFDTTNSILAENLKRNKKHFIIIIEDSSLVDKLKDMGYSAFTANILSELDMKDFKLNKAKKVIIDIRDTSKTVYAALVAKSLIGNDKNIVVVATTLELEKYLRTVGINNIINPASMAAAEISKNM